MDYPEAFMIEKRKNGRMTITPQTREARGWLEDNTRGFSPDNEDGAIHCGQMIGDAMMREYSADFGLKLEEATLVFKSTGGEFQRVSLGRADASTDLTPALIAWLQKERPILNTGDTLEIKVA